MTMDTWAALVGFVLPALIAVVNRVEWKPWVKGIVALAASVVVGTGTALLSGGFTGVTWIKAVGVVFAASQVAYHTWWKTTDITSWIEQAINIISAKSDGDNPSLGGTAGKSGGGLK